MLVAIEQARRNLKSRDGGPFGACIVKDGEVLSAARNTVLKNDATCHAEINAIRKASRKIGSFDLSGCVIYSTTEPCPMCFAAIHWARIDAIVYGTTTRQAKQIGFNELVITDARLKAIGNSRVVLIRSRLAGECRELFRQWALLPDRKMY